MGYSVRAPAVLAADDVGGVGRDAACANLEQRHDASKRSTTTEARRRPLTYAS